MEDKLYEAIARVILQPFTDQYGNMQPSPLVGAISNWANNQENRDKLVKLVGKNINMDDLVAKVSEKLKYDFSGWSGDVNKEKLKNMVWEKLAEKLAEEKLAKMKLEDSTPTSDSQGGTK